MTEANYSVLDRIGRIRLSENFFMREFLYSETAIFNAVANVPDNLDLAVEAGTQLCEQLLEPIQARFGRVHIRSAFRSCAVNALGNDQGRNCASNDRNFADHIWDRKDAAGNMGATACIVVPAVTDLLAEPGDWTEFAWWIHDNLAYSSLCFFTQRMACNVQWRENPERRIDSWLGRFENGKWLTSRTLTKPSMVNHAGDHSHLYARLTERFGP